MLDACQIVRNDLIFLVAVAGRTLSGPEEGLPRTRVNARRGFPLGNATSSLHKVEPRKTVFCDSLVAYNATSAQST
jgi:hypothetical protein